MERRERLTIHLYVDWRMLVTLVVLIAGVAIARADAGASPTGGGLPIAAADMGQVGAAVAGGVRRFYLTNTTHLASVARRACGPGYHMASLWEILDVSNLSYAHDHPSALMWDDSGYGPPSGLDGWVRTGWTSAGSGAAGQKNCQSWTSSSVVEMGSTVFLIPSWASSSGTIGGTWYVGSSWCSENRRVWCVED